MNYSKITGFDVFSKHINIVFFLFFFVLFFFFFFFLFFVFFFFSGLFPSSGVAGIVLHFFLPVCPVHYILLTPSAAIVPYSITQVSPPSFLSSSLSLSWYQSICHSPHTSVPIHPLLCVIFFAVDGTFTDTLTC